MPQPRLVYVADSNSNKLKLVPGQQLEAKNYVALSHCWGKLTDEEKQQFCTAQQNINRREKGFNISDLPRTFQDDVEVTRRLDLQYIWIDSLCIIQGEGGDWEEEAQRTEDVYASAYLTLAASSAVDLKSGFLERIVNSEYIYTQDGSDRQVHECIDVEDFDNHVEKAQLNTRAWVMQERFLSCRTIHFSAGRTYWECGRGVYYKDLTRLTT